MNDVITDVVTSLSRRMLSCMKKRSFRRTWCEQQILSEWLIGSLTGDLVLIGCTAWIQIHILCGELSMCMKCPWSDLNYASIIVLCYLQLSIKKGNGWLVSWFKKKKHIGDGEYLDESWIFTSNMWKKKKMCVILGSVCYITTLEDTRKD